MTAGVRIPISADAAAATRAFADIQAAIRRAGQEGRAFSDLDLSHPELEKVADDLRRVQANVETLTRVGRGETAAAMRRLDRADREPGAINGGTTLFGPNGLMNPNRIFPNQNQAQAFTAAAGRYILQGTSYQIPPQQAAAPPGPAAPAPPAGGGAGGGGNGGLGGLLSGLMKNPIVGGILAASGITGLAKEVGHAVGSAQEEGAGNDALLRHTGGGAREYDQLRDAMRDATKGLQLTYQESERLGLAWAKLTNETDPSQIASNVRYGVGFARGYGIDAGQTNSTFGRAQQLGEDPKKFALLISEAVQSGHLYGQVDQTMQAVLRWTEASTRQTMTQSGSAEFAALYATMNAPGSVPGLKGGAGEALLGQVNSAISQGGASGDASMALSYRALAAHGVTDPYKIEYQLAGGMFGKLPDGTTNFDAVRQTMSTMYAGAPNEARWHAEGQYYGVGIRQAEQLEKLSASPNFGTLGKWLESSGTDLGKLSPGALGEMNQVMDPNVDLQGWRRRMLDPKSGYKLTGEEQESLSRAPDGDLRELMVRLLGEHGQEQNEATKSAQASADMANALTTLGNALMPMVTTLKESVAIILKGIGDPAEWLKAHAPDSDVDSDLFGQTIGERAADTWGTSTGAALPGSDLDKAMRRYAPGAVRDAQVGGHLGADLPASIDAKVRAAATDAGLDPDWMAALARTEGGVDANGRPRTSSAGARGVMQLMPGTMPQYDHEDEDQNIKGGTAYFKSLLAQFNGDYDAASAAYNAGPGGRGVKEWAAGKGPFSAMPPETQSYIASIHKVLKGKVGAAKLPPGAPWPEAPLPPGMTEEEYRESMQPHSSPGWEIAPPDAPSEMEQRPGMAFRNIPGVGGMGVFDAATAPGAGPAPETRRPGGDHQGFAISPLRVVHETKDGDHLGTDYLPVTNVALPQSWNPAGGAGGQ